VTDNCCFLGREVQIKTGIISILMLGPNNKAGKGRNFSILMLGPNNNSAVQHQHTFTFGFGSI
tara:strand:- start:709 stop:897 length:189 start_codon:yes stop_codon:yes gene_type:complete